MISASHSAVASTFVFVEQLNRAQWHASSPSGSWRTSGVQSYVGAVADALWMSVGSGLGVMSIDLDGNRLVLQHPETA